jgi:hypothetical protein
MVERHTQKKEPQPFSEIGVSHRHREGSAQEKLRWLGMSERAFKTTPMAAATDGVRANLERGLRGAVKSKVLRYAYSPDRRAARSAQEKPRQFTEASCAAVITKSGGP